jgi:hypothetical protein
MAFPVHRRNNRRLTGSPFFGLLSTIFGHAEPMPVHKQNQRRVTMAVPADLPGSTKQALHLGGHQVLTGTPSGILWFRGGQLCRK